MRWTVTMIFLQMLSQKVTILGLIFIVGFLSLIISDEKLSRVLLLWSQNKILVICTYIHNIYIFFCFQNVMFSTVISKYCFIVLNLSFISLSFEDNTLARDFSIKVVCSSQLFVGQYSCNSPQIDSKTQQPVNCTKENVAPGI